MSVSRWPGSRDRATDSSGYRSDHWRRIWNVLNVEVFSCATKSHASAHVTSENSGGGTSGFMMRVHFRDCFVQWSAGSPRDQKSSSGIHVYSPLQFRIADSVQTCLIRQCKLRFSSGND